MSELPSEKLKASGGFFPQTHWSVILKAGDQNSPLHRQALDDFCETYRDPVYFFIRGTGNQPADAEDLTQDFFAWLLQKQILARLTRRGGRFRYYLRRVLQRFLINKYRQRKTIKAGGGVQIVQIDAATETRCLARIKNDIPPEVLFDTEWAKRVCAQAFKRLRDEYKTAPKQRRFNYLQAFLSADPEAPSYTETAKALRITQGAVKQEVYRMRLRYGLLLRMELAAPGTSKEKVDQELRYLLTVLASE